jgi:tight adherence protein C
MGQNHELSRKIYNKKLISKTSKKIKLLGLSSNLDPIDFLNMRFIFSIMVFIILLFISKYGYVVAPIGTFVFYKLFEYFMLDDKIKKRSSKLEGEAIQFFEVLTLSLDTGRNLEDAINVTVSNVSGDLSLEFKEVMREVKFGKSLTEALVDMEENIPSININNIVLSLTQTDLYGTSIIANMYEQIDYMREKRKMEVKSQISKIPIKISVISVLFFVPLILLIILAPVILSYLG